MTRRSPYRRTVVGIAAGAGILVAAAALPTDATVTLATATQAAAVEAGAQLPDLVADPPTHPLLESYGDSAGSRLLLRFNGYIHNAGTGALEVRASHPEGPVMSSVQQRVFDAGGGARDVVSDPAPTVLYEPDDTHDHWHLRSAARYALWDRQRLREVAPAMKAGFCLLDSQRMDSFAPRSASYTYAGISFCQQGRPTATEVVMGVSPGWRDVYGRGLAFQWVDVSDAAPGEYWLSSEVDPDGVLVESDEVNPRAFAATASTVPGYLATSFARRVDPVLVLPTSISLPAQRYGSPGTLEFRIEEGPKVGQLDKPVGTWFRGSTVQYTAPMGYRGQDSFRFSARSAESPFPRTPRVATASVGVRTEPVPTATAGASGATTLQMAEAPRRAPSLSGPAPRSGEGPLTVPEVLVHGTDVVVRTVAGSAGTVTIRARDGDVELGGCTVRAPAGRPVTCLVEAEAPVRAVGVSAVASLLDTAGRTLGRTVAAAGSAVRDDGHH